MNNKAHQAEPMMLSASQIAKPPPSTFPGSRYGNDIWRPPMTSSQTPTGSMICGIFSLCSVLAKLNITDMQRQKPSTSCPGAGLYKFTNYLLRLFEHEYPFLTYPIMDSSHGLPRSMFDVSKSHTGTYTCLQSSCSCWPACRANTS